MAAEAYVRVARHAGLQEKDELLRALGELPGEPGEIADTLRRHGLVRLALSLVSPAELRLTAPELAPLLERWRGFPGAWARALLAEFAEVAEALDAEPYPWLLLKGFCFAERLYGGLDRRPQTDVDVLVQERDFRRALGRLRALGLARQGYDLHSWTLVRGGLRLDLHRCLRRAPAFQLDERLVWAQLRPVRIEGRDFRTLSDESTLVLLALSAFEDLGQGLARLGQLLDLLLFLRCLEPDLDWAGFLARRQRENLAGVCAAVFALVLDLFEAREELPRLSAALGDKPVRRDEAVALALSPPKRAENLAWFARVYPGSLALYLAWFWWGGFPSNLRPFPARRLLESLRLALRSPARLA